MWSENCGKFFRFHATLRTRQMPNANATISRGKRTADIVNIVAAIPCAFFTLTRYVMYSRRQLWPGHRNCWIELLTVSESDFSRLAVSRLRRRQVGSRECLRQRATARASLHFRSGKAEGRGFAARKCRCAESDYRRRFSDLFLICSCKFEVSWESRSSSQGLASSPACVVARFRYNFYPCARP